MIFFTVNTSWIHEVKPCILSRPAGSQWIRKKSTCKEIIKLSEFGQGTCYTQDRHFLQWLQCRDTHLKQVTDTLHQGPPPPRIPPINHNLCHSTLNNLNGYNSSQHESFHCIECLHKFYTTTPINEILTFLKSIMLSHAGNIFYLIFFLFHPIIRINVSFL